MLGISIPVLLVAACAYNAVLAFAIAHGVNLGQPAVVMTELSILAMVGLLILRSGRLPTDPLGFLVITLAVIDGLVVSLASGAPFIDMIRNGAIIALFLLLGARADERRLKQAFLACALLVFAFILLEIIDVAAYAKQFAPALYFERTRGVEQFEFDDSGLFRNALGFEGRFSLSNLFGHRTSSLFLEQVSLANFSSVLLVYLVALWKRLPIVQRCFYIGLIILILLSNNSRTGLALALIAPLIYFAARGFNRFVPAVIMPVILMIGVVVVLALPPSVEDDFNGRVDLTMASLSKLDLPALLGRKALVAGQFADSGYTFVIYSTSIVGLLLLWALVSLVLAVPGFPARRAAFVTSLYIFINLLVSGNAIFSIKTAALLWFLIGFLRNEAIVGSVAVEKTRQSRPAPGRHARERLAPRRVALDDCGLRPFARRPGSDAVRIIAPPLAAGPIGPAAPNIAIAVEKVEQSIEGSKADRRSRTAEFAKERARLLAPQPVGHARKSLASDRGRNTIAPRPR